jgi:hypothetical protein
MIVECWIQPFLPISLTCISLKHTYIPNTPRRQCLTVFNPASHWHDVISPPLLMAVWVVTASTIPCAGSVEERAESERNVMQNSVLAHYNASLCCPSTYSFGGPQLFHFPLSAECVFSFPENIYITLLTNYLITSNHKFKKFWYKRKIYYNQYARRLYIFSKLISKYEFYEHRSCQNLRIMCYPV